MDMGVNALGCLPRIGVAGLYGNLMLNYLRNQGKVCS